jgi:hypothetical protein
MTVPRAVPIRRKPLTAAEDFGVLVKRGPFRSRDLRMRDGFVWVSGLGPHRMGGQSHY